MKKKMVLSCSLLLAALAATAADSGKNCYDVKFAPLPNDYGAMLKTHADDWNFNFRPYGASSDWLWSDSNVRRSVAEGADLEDRMVTGLFVACDEDGFNVLVYCNVPELKTYLSMTNEFPSQSLEFFVCPDDADTPAVQQRYMAYYGNGACREYENREPDKDFRLAKPEVTETPLRSAIVVKIHWDWKNFWMRLPLFCTKADNFWRLSMIRWSGAGVTWGGTVHQNSQAGYIRWPDFTDAQRKAILKRTLENGWRELCATLADNRMAITNVRLGTEKFRTEHVAANPRSYVNMNEDPGFRPVFESMVAERRALVADIGRIDGMSRAELDAFYRKAAPMLFNFTWDLQEAYAKCLADQLFVK